MIDKRDFEFEREINLIKEFLINQFLRGVTIFKLTYITRDFELERLSVFEQLFDRLNNLEFAFFYQISDKTIEFNLILGVKSILGVNDKLKLALDWWALSAEILSYKSKAISTPEFLEELLLEFNGLTKNSSLILDVFDLIADDFAGMAEILSITEIKAAKFSFNKKPIVGNKLIIVNSVPPGLVLIYNYCNLKNLFFFDGKILNKNHEIVYKNKSELILDLENIFSELTNLFFIEMRTVNYISIKQDLINNDLLVFLPRS